MYWSWQVLHADCIVYDSIITPHAFPTGYMINAIDYLQHGWQGGTGALLYSKPFVFQDTRMYTYTHGHPWISCAEKARPTKIWEGYQRTNNSTGKSSVSRVFIPELCSRRPPGGTSTAHGASPALLFANNSWAPTTRQTYFPLFQENSKQHVLLLMF